MVQGKVTPLPATLTGDVITRPVTIDRALMPYIAGALEWLADKEPFDETGALTIEAARELFGEMLWEFYNGKVSGAVIGQIAQFGLTAPPDGWLECNGQSVAIADYPDLFAAIGENFGFSVGGNFVLPDMRFRSPVGLGELDYDPTYEIALGEKIGSAEIGLSTTNIPAHNHTLQRITGSGAQTGFTGVTGASFASVTSVTGSTGSGTPFDIISPVIGLLICIYAGE